MKIAATCVVAVFPERVMKCREFTRVVDTSSWPKFNYHLGEKTKPSHVCASPIIQLTRCKYPKGAHEAPPTRGHGQNVSQGKFRVISTPDRKYRSIPISCFMSKFGLSVQKLPSENAA